MCSVCRYMVHQRIIVGRLYYIRKNLFVVIVTYFRTIVIRSGKWIFFASNTQTSSTHAFLMELTCQFRNRRPYLMFSCSLSRSTVWQQKKLSRIICKFIQAAAQCSNSSSCHPTSCIVLRKKTVTCQPRIISILLTSIGHSK